LPPGDSTEFDQFIVETLSEFADSDRPGMHSSPSLDFDVVLTGEVGLELDDGEVLLGPGDIVVLNGSVHRWHNRGSTFAQIVSMTIGAEHERYPTP
jgi:quercetin dioxygenase-like cupin family protein